MILPLCWRRSMTVPFVNLPFWQRSFKDLQISSQFDFCAAIDARLPGATTLVELGNELAPNTTKVDCHCEHARTTLPREAGHRQQE
jgi:hypothetical protein